MTSRCYYRIIVGSLTIRLLFLIVMSARAAQCHRVFGVERCGVRWDRDRHAAGAGGRAKAGRQATYLLIRPRRKSPCIYFELAGAGTGEGGGARADADAGLAPEGFPSAPRPASPPRRSRSPRTRAFPCCRENECLIYAEQRRVIIYHSRCAPTK